jgi:hypothetical protein
MYAFTPHGALLVVTVNSPVLVGLIRTTIEPQEKNGEGFG